MAETRTPLGNGKKQMIEKVENRGLFRIVGQVYESKENQKRVLGYGIIDVKNAKLKLFTTKQTLELLKRYKFENATIEGENKIVNTECSMDRLIKFDTKQNVIGNAGVTILGQIFVNGKYDGYRILNESGRVLDITEETLLKVTNNGDKLPILNAKVVSREGSKDKFVSAIKGEFKKIEKSEFDKMLDSLHPSGKSTKELHDNYRKNVVSRIINNVAHYGYLNLSNTAKNTKDIKIFLEEFVKPTYGESYKELGLNIDEATTLYALSEINKGKVYCTTYTGKIAVNQRSLSKSNRERYAYNKSKVFILNKPFSEKAVALASVHLDESVEAYIREVNAVIMGTVREIDLSKSSIDSVSLRKIARRVINREIKAEGKDRPEYSIASLDFESTEGIKALGYTTNKLEIGTEYVSPVYGKIELRYLGSLLRHYESRENTAESMLDNINCFGDVELMKKCAELMTGRGYGREEVVKAQAYLFVLAVNNPYLAKIVQNQYTELELPINEVSKEKFQLDAEDDLFYKSGGKFNRFTTLKRFESWAKPSDNKGSLANFTGGYFAAMSLYLTIDGHAERGLIDN